MSLVFCIISILQEFPYFASAIQRILQEFYTLCACLFT